MNPSLLLGPGDERLSSTKVVLDFLGRKIMTVPAGGLSFVDARDAARAFYIAMGKGAHAQRYLLGTVNWTFNEFFGRLERLTKIAGPRFGLPSKLAITGAQGLNALYRRWKLAPPVEPAEVEMADYFWYFNASKARRSWVSNLATPLRHCRHGQLCTGEFSGNSAFGVSVEFQTYNLRKPAETSRPSRLQAWVP